MNDATTYEGDIKVFTADGEEWVAARDVADAEAVWLEQAGFPLEDVGWTLCDPAKTLQWREDEDGPGVPVTYAELAKRGRGYLGSANY